MRLEPGTRLGPYEVLSPIGSGGMGEVWEGRDSRLDRRVAIKVSREQFSDRFDREARAVAALNHPHICTLHDVGPNYLVMELIDGKPLAGPLPMADAFRTAIQIADALEAAHRKGITHRDLKPANVLITRSGVKLLDFGLAKVQAVAAAIGDDDRRPADGPTAFLTEDHAVIGTPQYMSPEQLRGSDVDARSDIFSFGLVLHEMFTGHLPPERSGAIAVAAARAPITPLPTEVGRLIRTCLAEDPADRFQSASDLKRALEWTRDDAKKSSPTSARTNRLAWAVAAAAAIAAAALALWPRAAPAVEVTRFTVSAPPGTKFPPAANATVSAPQVALSPDGRVLAFVVAQRSDKPTMWLRFMDDAEPRPIAGSDGASYPFWSPDNKWIGFFADGQIKKVLAAGGPPQVITQSPTDPRGATWNVQDVILIGNNSTGPIKQVSAAGGPIADATALQQDVKERNHRWPYFLPDGRHFLYVVRGGLPERTGVYVGSLDGRVKKRLVASSWAAAYAAGHLLYLEANTLMARPFDLASLELSGEPIVVAEGVGSSTAAYSSMSASQSGALAYAAPTVDIGKLTWVEKSGKAGATVGGDAAYIDFRLSPDEQRLAVAIFDPGTGTPDIWLTDLTRGNASAKLTSNPWTDAGPVWSPDGTKIAFRTNRAGTNDIYVKTAGGGGNEQMLLPDMLFEQARLGFVSGSPTAWSSKGTYILYAATMPQTGWDLWLVDLGAQKPVAYLQESFDQIQGTFSPDGRLIAYSSNEDGRFQVYVQTFPVSDDKWKISVDGGFEPHWSADGTELFFLSEDLALMSTPIVTMPTFKPGTPQRLFQTQVPEGVSPYRSRYDVSKDGKRFLVFTQTNSNAPTGITTVLNWTAGLKR